MNIRSLNRELGDLLVVKNCARVVGFRGRNDVVAGKPSRREDRWIELPYEHDAYVRNCWRYTHCGLLDRVGSIAGATQTCRVEYRLVLTRWSIDCDRGRAQMAKKVPRLPVVELRRGWVLPRFCG